MSDDAVLRLFAKVDDIADRLTRLETMLAEREKSQGNIAEILAWLVTTAVAIYGAARWLK